MLSTAIADATCTTRIFKQFLGPPWSVTPYLHLWKAVSPAIATSRKLPPHIEYLWQDVKILVQYRDLSEGEEGGEMEGRVNEWGRIGRRTKIPERSTSDHSTLEDENQKAKGKRAVLRKT